MASDALKAVLDRVLTWPPDRQDAAARVLAEMERQDTSSYRLTDAQVAEVERRLAEPNPQSITMADARARLRKLGA